MNKDINITETTFHSTIEKLLELEVFKPKTTYKQIYKMHTKGDIDANLLLKNFTRW